MTHQGIRGQVVLNRCLDALCEVFCWQWKGAERNHIFRCAGISRRALRHWLSHSLNTHCGGHVLMVFQIASSIFFFCSVSHSIWSDNNQMSPDIDQMSDICEILPIAHFILIFRLVCLCIGERMFPINLFGCLRHIWFHFVQIILSK